VKSDVVDLEQEPSNTVGGSVELDASDMTLHRDETIVARNGLLAGLPSRGVRDVALDRKEGARCRRVGCLEVLGDGVRILISFDMKGAGWEIDVGCNATDGGINTLSNTE
jgi:hypothetical protein